MRHEGGRELRESVQTDVAKATEVLSRWFNVAALRIGPTGRVYFDELKDPHIRERVSVVNASQVEVGIIRATLEKINLAISAGAITKLPDSLQLHASERSSCVELSVRPHERDATMWQCYLQD